MHPRNNKRYSPDDYNYTPRKRRQLSTKEDIRRAGLITSHNEQLPLFTRLPRELRDMIWEYAFGSEETMFHYRNLLIQASSPQFTYCDGREAGLPDWLLICKTLIEEALEVFYRTQTYTPATEWRTSRPRPLPIGFRRLCSKSICYRSPPNPTDHSGYKNPLLFNKGIKNVGIAESFSLTWPRNTDASPPDLHFTPDVVAGMFMRYLQKLDLKDVKITCEVRNCSRSCIFAPWVSEEKRQRKGRPSGRLEALRGRCRSLTVLIDSCRCRDSDPMHRERQDWARAPVEAWAKGIVGGDTEVRVSVDEGYKNYRPIKI